MVVIETVLGNIRDPEWAARLSAADIDLLEIDQWEAQKSRFRKTTAKGAKVAVSVDRGTYIRDGDVLLWDAQARSRRRRAYRAARPDGRASGRSDAACARRGDAHLR